MKLLESSQAMMSFMSDEHVKAELQSVAENVTEVAFWSPLLPAPTLSVSEWFQVNDDVKPKEHNSNGRVIEGSIQDIFHFDSIGLFISLAVVVIHVSLIAWER